MTAFSRMLLFMLLLLLVCSVVWFVQSPALTAKALFVDDHQYVIHNSLVLTPSWYSTGRFLSEVLEPSTVRGYYQPLSMISLMLDVAMGGSAENLMPFHRTSLLLHVLNTGLVLILLRQLFGNAVIAALTALIFGLHPLTVETIPWVGERKTVLATFFALWSIIAHVVYAQRGKRKFLVASSASFFLALMAKPTVTMLPVVLLLMDVWPLRRDVGPGRGPAGNRFRLWTALLLEKAPHFALAGAFGVITYISQARTASVQLPAQYGFDRIPLLVCHNIIFYLRKFLWPTWLTPYYPFPAPFDLTSPSVLIGVVGTAILLVALAVSIRRTRAFLISWLIFFTAIFPTLGVVGFTVVIASDKYAYFPMLGFFMLFAAGLHRVWQGGRFVSSAAASGVSAKSGPALRFLIVVPVLGVAVLEGSATHHYLGHWQDDHSLFTYMLPLAPRSPYLRFAVGHDAYMAGRWPEAEAQFRKALEFDPTYVDPMNNLGLIFADTGRLPEALQVYAAALVLKPDDADVLCNRGIALQSAGNLKEAEADFRRAIAASPRHANARINLANLLMDQGRYEEARALLAETRDLWPNRADVLISYASVLKLTGKRDEAERQLAKALRIEPRNAAGHFNYGRLLMDTGRANEAIAHFKQAAEMTPQNAAVWLSYARACAAAGRRDEALSACRNVLLREPEDPEARSLVAELEPR